MVKEKKERNPADAFRKEQRKKDIEKSKKNQAAVREVRSLLNDPDKIDAEIAKTQKLSNENKLDKGLKDKIAELKAMKEVALQKQKVLMASTSREEVKPIVAPKAVLRRPEDSVYYHPEFNKTGAPPPGQPMRYKSDYAGVPPPPPPPRPGFVNPQMMMMAQQQQQLLMFQQQQMMYQQQQVQQQPYSYLTSSAPPPPPPAHPTSLPVPTSNQGGPIHPSMLPRPMMMATAPPAAFAGVPPPPPPQSLLAQLQAQSQLNASKPPRKERPRKPTTVDPLDPAGQGYTERFGSAPKPVPAPEPVRTAPLYPVMDYPKTVQSIPAAAAPVQFVPASSSGSSSSSSGGGANVATAQDKEALLRSMYFTSEQSTDVDEDTGVSQRQQDDRYYDNMDNEEEEEEDRSGGEESSDDSSDDDEDENDSDDDNGDDHDAGDEDAGAAGEAQTGPVFVPPMVTVSAEELMRRRLQVPPAPASSSADQQQQDWTSGPSLPSAAELMRRRFQVTSSAVEQEDDNEEAAGPSIGPSMGPAVGPPMAYYPSMVQGSDPFDDDPEASIGPSLGPAASYGHKYDRQGVDDDDDDAEDVYVAPRVVKSSAAVAAAPSVGGLLGLMDYGDDDEEDAEQEDNEPEVMERAVAAVPSQIRYPTAESSSSAVRCAPSVVGASTVAAPSKPVSRNLPKIARTDAAITALVPNVLKVKRQQQQQQHQTQQPMKQARVEEYVPERRPVHAYLDHHIRPASSAAAAFPAASMDAELDAFMSEINGLGDI